MNDIRQPLARVALGAFSLALAVGAITRTAEARDDRCSVRICAEDRHFRGGQNGGRCERSTPPFDYRSHYTLDGPICPDGWRVNGDNCRKIDCCVRPACDADERYRGGVCYSGPSGIGGYRSHHDAECPRGWTLDRAAGLCERNGCVDDGRRPLTAEQRRQPPPPARPAGPNERQHPRQAGPDDPPPPARAGNDGNTYAARITGYDITTCVDRGGTVVVRGGGFGARQGTRRVHLGGFGISVRLTVVEWSDQRLRVVIPDDPRIQQGQLYYIGVQDDRGQWISNISERIRICGPLQ
jgi:hypothetical protein